jgi:N-acetylglucosamine kinase-like BadF-type ATPase
MSGISSTFHNLGLELSTACYNACDFTRKALVATVLGVDGGASKTHALIVHDSGQVLGFGQSGVANHQVEGLETALREIESAARQALDQASATPAEVAIGYFCLGGADLPEDYAMLTPALEALGLCQSVILKNDSLAALRAGLSRSWGVVVICGSGFNAAGRAPDGREIVLPGLGALSGDWGCGSDLSREMIRLVMRAWDGRGQPTLLTGLVLQALDAPSEAILLGRLYRKEIERQRVLDLVPVLFEAAEAGDDVARHLIVRMGLEVGVSAKTLIRRLDLPADVEIVLAGSVFKGKGSLLLDTITRTVLDSAPQARILRPRYEPVVGAALLGLDALGITPTPASLQSLDASLPPALIRVTSDELRGAN